MKKIFSKRSLMSVIAFFGCLAIAVIAMAVPAVGDSTRTVTIDMGTVLNENYLGLGDNLWVGPYAYGTNDAYQTVNDQRTNTVKPAYVRMMFLPNWLVDASLTPEEQEYNWTHGIYTWDSVEFKSFVRNAQTVCKAGGKIQLNMGGRITVEMTEWYAIKSVSLSEAGTRSAPKDIPAFARATVAVIQKLKEYGIEVEYLSFHNEVNGGNFEAFFDKRHYWCGVVEQVAIELDNAGLRDIEKNKAGTRDGIYINATELAGWADEPEVMQFLEYAEEHLIKNGYADGLVTHLYQKERSYDEVVELCKQLRAAFPNGDMLINEFNGTGEGTVESEYGFNYKGDATANVIAHANAGFEGSAGWFFYGTLIAHPISNGTSDISSTLWETPGEGLDRVGEWYGDKGLMMRYIPKNSKVVKTESDSNDILAATFVKDDDCTILLSAEESDSARKLKVYVGDKFIGRKFGVHVNNGPGDTNDNGLYDNKLPREDGDLLPVRTKVLTVDEKGYLTYDIPYGEDIRTQAIIMTTLSEQIQIVLEENELTVAPGGSVDINVKEVFGTDCTDFKFEIYDYSSVKDEQEDYEFASSATLASIGTLEQNASGIATFNAASNLSVGDTVAIKVTPNETMPEDTAGYTIAIINVGQYRVYPIYRYYTNRGASTTAFLVETGSEVNISDSLPNPTFTGLTFKGWYTNPEFTGEPITKTDASWNSTTYIYGKWSKNK